MQVVAPAKQQNLLWPLRRGSKGFERGLLAARLESALRNLVRTRLGSLRWAPTYGSLIPGLRTQNISEQLREQHKQLFLLSVGRWIPDIVVMDVTFAQSPRSPRLSVRIKWQLPDAVDKSHRPIMDPVTTTVLI